MQSFLGARALCPHHEIGDAAVGAPLTGVPGAHGVGGQSACQEAQEGPYHADCICTAGSIGDMRMDPVTQESLQALAEVPPEVLNELKEMPAEVLRALR